MYCSQKLTLQHTNANGNESRYTAPTNLPTTKEKSVKFGKIKELYLL